MKRAIITGATSMLGIALIEECLKYNISVVAIVRPKSEKIYRLPKSDGVEIVECDITNYHKLPELISNNGGVFYHFAWSGTGKRRNENIGKQISNINYTVEAINAAYEIGADAFIGAGSQAEYGKVQQGKIGPDTLANPNTPYGVCKFAAGRMALAQGRINGMRAIWVRVFSVYGIYDKPTSMISQAIKKILNHEKTAFTKATQIWDYLFSADAGRAFFLLGKFGKSQAVYCLGSGEARQLYEYLNIIKELTSPKYNLGIGEIPFEKASIMNLHADIQNLVEDTGFSPAFSFEEGVSEMIDYYKQNK